MRLELEPNLRSVVLVRLANEHCDMQAEVLVGRDDRVRIVASRVEKDPADPARERVSGRTLERGWQTDQLIEVLAGAGCFALEGPMLDLLSLAGDNLPR